jgi:heparosan-N-sulfate-glucuronate 5-epimerase
VTLVSELKAGYLSLVGAGTEFEHQPLGPRVDPGRLDGYYLDLRAKAHAASAYPDGFPRLPREGHRADWAVPVAQAALGYWELHLEGRPTLDRFLELADWLMAHAQPDGRGGLLWHADFALPKYGLAPGWPSALGQAQAISTLLRAHAVTNSWRYAATALAAAEPLHRPVSAGGLGRRIDGLLVLEEYPTRLPCAVLNGWIAALLGVHEFWLVTGDVRARVLFDDGYEAVLRLLERYDVGWWTLYSLYPHSLRDLAKPNYQRLHPVLLDALALVRPHPVLTRMAARWRAQVTPANLARCTVEKLLFRLSRTLDK